MGYFHKNLIFLRAVVFPSHRIDSQTVRAISFFISLDTKFNLITKKRNEKPQTLTPPHTKKTADLKFLLNWIGNDLEKAGNISNRAISSNTELLHVHGQLVEALNPIYLLEKKIENLAVKIGRTLMWRYYMRFIIPRYQNKITLKLQWVYSFMLKLIKLFLACLFFFSIKLLLHSREFYWSWV